MNHHSSEDGHSGDNLATYLSDHLAGSEAAVALLEGWRGHVRDAGVATSLDELLADILLDQRTLEELSLRATGEKRTLKRAAGWLVEKIARLKHLSQHANDDFALFESLELLSLGIQGKRALWAVLHELAPIDSRLAGFEFGVLEHRATAQYLRADELRREMGVRALRSLKA